MITVGIVGATGYTGVELLRILLQHPGVELRVATSRAEAGKPVADIFPNLRGSTDLYFVSPADADLAACDVVFFATPHGTAMHQIPALIDAGVRIIDLSADYRIRNQSVWEKTYQESHVSPQLLDMAVYGLPEWNREAIVGAQLLACPGCYPTAVQLGLLPLIKGGVVNTDSLIADVKSGVSGAGRNAKLGSLFSETADSLTAYAASGHRHQPEIEQGLEIFGGLEQASLTFVPHLIPMNRGIHATLYAKLSNGAADIQMLFEDCYKASAFVDVMPSGSHPATRSVRGANACRIAVHQPNGGDTIVVLSVIDNLVKGASGQAVQGMNLMFGLPEATGLSTIGLLP